MMKSSADKYPWLSSFAQSRFFWLLLSIMLMILVSTELPTTTAGRLEDGAGIMVVLLGTTIAARGGHKRFWLMFALNLLVLLTWFYSFLHPTVAVRLCCFILFIISLFIALCFTLAYVLRAGVITFDHILGAISAYVLIAMIFSTFYMLVWVVDHDAFKGLDAASERPWADFFYFSSTTLSTVGYGDIYPASYRARSLVIIEQFLGTFYIAILISRLTGLYTAGGPAVTEDQTRAASSDTDITK